MRALCSGEEGVRLDPKIVCPEPTGDEVLIAPIVVGISWTDLCIARGELPFEGVIGRECVGRVEAVGPNGDKNLVGQRVVCEIATRCGKCELCRGGIAGHCQNRTVMGSRGRNGCLADWFVLPGSNCRVVPEGLDDDRAVFAISVAEALQVARQITVKGRPYITVVGDGTSGLLVAQALEPLNASVRVVGQSAQRMGLCERWGIKHRPIGEIGRRSDQDVVVDCSGTSAGFGLSMALLRPRGQLVLKAQVAGARGIDLGLMVRKEIHAIGSDQGPLGEALRALLEERFDVISLIGRRMRLNDGAKILQMAASSESGKVLVTP